MLVKQRFSTFFFSRRTDLYGLCLLRLHFWFLVGMSWFCSSVARAVCSDEFSLVNFVSVKDGTSDWGRQI